MTGSNIETVFDPGDSVKLFSYRATADLLATDLRERATVYAWIYLLKRPFTDTLLRDHLEHSDVFAIIDHRQKQPAAELAATFKTFHAWTWSTNRTQHAKTLVIPALNVTWLMSHNLTHGAWHMSVNHAARIHSASFAHNLLNRWTIDRLNAKAVHPAT